MSVNTDHLRPDTIIALKTPVEGKLETMEDKIQSYLTEINDLLESLKECVKNAPTIEEKWKAIDCFMLDIEALAEYQPMTTRKSFNGLKEGKDVEGNTRYIKHLQPMPIMVNSIQDEDGALLPSPVSEMHIGEVNGNKCLLITPVQISLQEKEEKVYLFTLKDEN